MYDYKKEHHGGYIGSPKKARGGRTNKGYETMKKVKAGDVIIHSYHGKIVANRSYKYGKNKLLFCYPP